MAYPLNPTDQGALVAAAEYPQCLSHAWCRSRRTGHGARRSGRRISPGCSSTRRPRVCRAVTLPEVWFVYRTNPAISFWDTAAVADKMARFPFVVAFAYTRDETNHFADVLLPDATDLESLQLIRIGGSKFVEQFWDHAGLRAAPAGGGSRAAKRATSPTSRPSSRGAPACSSKYNAAINRGAAGVPLKGGELGLLARAGSDAYAPRGDLGRRVQGGQRRAHRRPRGARPRLVEGARARDHGRSRAPTGTSSPRWCDQGLRFELPYQERL